MTKINCPRCDYEWQPRVENPKACPRCKARLDTPPKKHICICVKGEGLSADCPVHALDVADEWQRRVREGGR